MDADRGELSIGFAANLVPLVESGQKTLTYRLGKKYEIISVGDFLKARSSPTNTVFGELEITEKTETTFKDLPIDRSGHETYSSKEEQRRIFLQYYGRVRDNDKVIVLGFRFFVQEV